VEGLLGVVDEALERKELPASVEDGREQLWLGEARMVLRDEARAERVLESFGTRAGGEALHTALRILLAEKPELDAALADYLLLGFHVGPAVVGFHHHPSVHAVNRMAQKVGMEIHRLTGILRFRELASGLFWAPVEPDFNVTWAVGRHFTTRLAQRHWMIHDIGRDTAVIWNGKRLERVEVVSPLLGGELPEDLFSDREKATQALWREYFRSIAIPARLNPRQQARCLPRRYWKWLIEKPGNSV
jgi:probable DNA metabolism protein